MPKNGLSLGRDKPLGKYPVPLKVDKISSPLALDTDTVTCTNLDVIGDLKVQGTVTSNITHTDATKLPLTGGTLSGKLLMGSLVVKQDIANVDEFDCNTLKVGGGATINAIYDEDDMAHDNPTGLATQQSTQTNSACDLFVSWNGDKYQGRTIYYVRRFMYNENDNRIWALGGVYEANRTTEAGDNRALTIAVDSAVTTDSITSMKVVTTYHVFDNS